MQPGQPMQLRQPRKAAFSLSTTVRSFERKYPGRIGELSPTDLKQFFALNPGNLEKVFLFPGSIFLEMLKKNAERVDLWPSNYLITTPVRLVKLPEDDTSKYSYPFCLPSNDEDEPLMTDFLFDIEEDWLKDQNEKAGTLRYGEKRLSDLSVDHYYLPLLRFKQKGKKEGREVREANLYAVGFLDITPNGQKISEFNTFQQNFGKNFDEGILNFICEENEAARKMVSHEPPRTHKELVNRNGKELRVVYMGEPRRILQNNHNEEGENPQPVLNFIMNGNGNMNAENQQQIPQYYPNGIGNVNPGNQQPFANFDPRGIGVMDLENENGDNGNGNNGNNGDNGDNESGSRDTYNSEESRHYNNLAQ